MRNTEDELLWRRPVSKDEVVKTKTRQKSINARHRSFEKIVTRKLADPQTKATKHTQAKKQIRLPAPTPSQLARRSLHLAAPRKFESPESRRLATESARLATESARTTYAKPVDHQVRRAQYDDGLDATLEEMGLSDPPVESNDADALLDALLDDELTGNEDVSVPPPTELAPNEFEGETNFDPGTQLNDDFLPSDALGEDETIGVLQPGLDEPELDGDGNNFGLENALDGNLEEEELLGDADSMGADADDSQKEEEGDEENRDKFAEFNGRNCEKDLEDCYLSLEQFRGESLRDITLDLTPSIDPSKKVEELPETLTKRLEDAPSRQWRDKQGNVIAEGSLADYRWGKVLVRQYDGTEIPIDRRQLSTEDYCFVASWWGLPTSCPPETSPYEPRNWTMTTFTWTASSLCHKPLYFQDEQLERYGHSWGPISQPIVSGVHFFGSLAFLPYKMGLNPPNECVYPLGYYRPGNCAPWLAPAIPLSARAAKMQIGVLAGGSAIFP